MPELNERARTVTLRLVFFGPPGSGKAANLQCIHELLPPDARSRIRAFDTGADRVVSFEMTLPGPQWSTVLTISACSSPLLKATKAAMVTSADAIAFVADANRARRDENHEAFRECEELLRETRRPQHREMPPVVLQVNKRDHADAFTEEEIEREWAARPWPIFTASAKRGEGVRETFTCLLRLAFESADRGWKVGSRSGLTLSAVTEAALRALRQPGDAAPKGGA